MSEEADYRHDDEDFTSQQRRELLEMLEDHKKARWFWSSLTLWVKYMLTVGASAAAIFMAYRELTRWRP